MAFTVLPTIPGPDATGPDVTGPDITAPDIASPGREHPGGGELRSAAGERLPMKALGVDACIVGLTATSTLRQRFANTGETALEVTYVFPLPARSGVTDFVATLGGRRVVGVLKERSRARLDYEEATAAGRRAAIAEEDRPEVFSVRVGNLGAGEEATVELVLTGPLCFEDGEATFRFPLVVAPRYSAGAPLPGDRTGAGLAADTDLVPDASRVTPPVLLDADARPAFEMRVSVDGAGLAVSDLAASLHSTVIETSPSGPIALRVAPGDRLDRDFLLRFRLDDTALASSAVLVPDTDRPAEGSGGSGAAEGTWSLTLRPPPGAGTAPRDVVVVLDRSGSMSGWKMVAARRAAGRIVDMLDRVDRFCVLGFDTTVETFDAASPALAEASDRRRFAVASWLGTLSARGGTEMGPPLRSAAGLLAASSGRAATLVLVTDGQVSGEDHLLAELSGSLGDTRVHCVGVDRAVNAGFLDRLSRLGRGRCELVESEDRLDEAMARLARTIGRPALTDVAVAADDMEIIDDALTPSRRPDAYPGIPCVISGRYRAAGPNPVLRIAADAPDGPFAKRVAPVVSASPAIRTIWARSALRDLEDRHATLSHTTDGTGLSERIVELSVRFGVLSRFTAFVAVDAERTDTGPLDEVVQPVEMPSGWSMGLAPGFGSGCSAGLTASGGTSYGMSQSVGSSQGMSSGMSSGSSQSMSHGASRATSSGMSQGTSQGSSQGASWSSLSSRAPVSASGVSWGASGAGRASPHRASPHRASPPPPALSLDGLSLDGLAAAVSAALDARTPERLEALRRALRGLRALSGVEPDPSRRALIDALARAVASLLAACSQPSPALETAVRAAVAALRPPAASSATPGRSGPSRAAGSFWT